MISLYQDPEGEKIFDRTDPKKAARMSHTITGDNAVNNDSDSEALKKKILELETIVAQYKVCSSAMKHVLIIYL